MLFADRPSGCELANVMVPEIGFEYGRGPVVGAPAARKRRACAEADEVAVSARCRRSATWGDETRRGKEGEAGAPAGSEIREKKKRKKKKRKQDEIDLRSESIKSTAISNSTTTTELPTRLL